MKRTEFELLKDMMETIASRESQAAAHPNDLQRQSYLDLEYSNQMKYFEEMLVTEKDL